MIYVDSLACWTANGLFNATGFIVALRAWDAVGSHKYRRLLWLVPVVLVSAWLESAFNSNVASHALAESARLSAIYWRMGQDLIGWPALALVVVGLRRAWSLRTTKSSTSGRPSGMRTDGSVDPELRGAVERFIEATDMADVATVFATYDPEFICVRVADEGGFVCLTREQMVSFWKRPGGHPGGHSVPARETVIHYAEVIGETGFVLLTRVKNLGKGWEPMFYNLVWKKRDSEWRLLREFVHQRSIPRWR